MTAKAAVVIKGGSLVAFPNQQHAWLTLTAVDKQRSFKCELTCNVLTRRHLHHQHRACGVSKGEGRRNGEGSAKQ